MFQKLGIWSTFSLTHESVRLRNAFFFHGTCFYAYRVMRNYYLLFYYVLWKHRSIFMWLLSSRLSFVTSKMMVHEKAWRVHSRGFSSSTHFHWAIDYNVILKEKIVAIPVNFSQLGFRFMFLSAIVTLSFLKMYLSVCVCVWKYLLSIFALLSFLFECLFHAKNEKCSPINWQRWRALITFIRFFIFIGLFTFLWWHIIHSITRPATAWIANTSSKWIHVCRF